MYESVDSGVPILGFPIFSDQHRNVDNLVEAGMAISMEIFSVTYDTFSRNVEELISNPKYGYIISNDFPTTQCVLFFRYVKNAKIASRIFKDRPMSPDKSVLYWTEYVIRHKGAPHLKSHAVSLTWIQYFLVDVFFVILIIMFIVLFVFYQIFKIFFTCTSKRSHTMKTKTE